MIGLQEPQRKDGEPISLAGNAGPEICKSGIGSLRQAPGQPESQHPCGCEGGEGAAIRVLERLRIRYREKGDIAGARYIKAGIGAVKRSAKCL